MRAGGKILYVSPYDSFANNKRKVRVRSHSVARTLQCLYTHFACGSYVITTYVQCIREHYTCLGMVNCLNFIN